MYLLMYLQILALYLSFIALGSPVYSFVYRNKDSNESDTRVPSLMFGLAFLTILSWYWFEIFPFGMVSQLFVVVPAFSVFLIIRKYRTKFLSILRSEIRQDIAPLTLSFLVFIFCGRYLFANFGSNVGSNNGDVAAYAQVSKFLLHNGFGQSGDLLGLPAGTIARTDVTGVLTTISFNTALLRIPIQEALNISLLFSFVLIAICAKRVLVILGINSFVANIVAVLPQTTFMVAYLSWCYFLSQLMGMSFMLAIFCVMITQIRKSHMSRQELLGYLASYSVLTAGLVMVYGHMSFVVISIVIFATLSQGLKSASFRGILVPAVGGLIGLVLVYSKSQLVLQKAVAFAGDKTNGWQLPYLLPSEILGFQWNETAKPTGIDLDLTIVLLFLVISSFAVLFSDRKLSKYIPNLIAISAIGIFYILLVVKDPNSYVQWKWITFFIPLIIITLFAGIVETFSKIIKHTFIIALLVAISVLNVARYEFRPEHGRYGSPPSSDEFDLDKSRKIQNLDELNIKSGPYLRSMWPAVYLTGIRTAILDPSYYSTLQPLLAPTLVSAEFPTAPFVNRDKINKTYDLVYPRADQAKFEVSSAKATIEIEDLASNFVVNSPNTLIVRVKNSGEVSWSGSGAFKGAVNLGVRTLSRNGSSHSQELAHCPIVEFPNYVNPNLVLKVNCAISFTESGKYEIELTPISEGEAWFSDVAPENRLVVLIDVK